MTPWKGALTAPERAVHILWNNHATMVTSWCQLPRKHKTLVMTLIIQYVTHAVILVKIQKFAVAGITLQGHSYSLRPHQLTEDNFIFQYHTIQWLTDRRLLLVLCDTRDTSMLIVDTYVTIPVSPRSRYISVYCTSKKYCETAQVS